MIRFDILVLY